MSDWTDTRPMSPHMQVWKWHVTMATSIFHRASGIALYLGAMLIAGWLVAAASGPEAYVSFAGILSSIPGQLVLFGFTMAVMYHFAKGLQYLFWDSGVGYSPAVANIVGWVTILFGIFGAVALWVVAGLI